MNNNGTGLVLASASLAGHPLVMLPIIFYNLVQHLIAGAIDHVRYRATEWEAPMIAVIFEVFPADGRKGDYLEHAARLESELERVGGFMSVERF
jgi:hypothetical protein